MTDSKLDALIFRALGDSDALASLVAHAAVDPPDRHLDEEAIAATLEDEPDPAALAHLLGCAMCRDQLAELETLFAVVPFRAAARPARGCDVALPGQRLLAATIRADDLGGFEVIGCSGTTRVQGALALRTVRGLRGISLRDAPNDPSFEIALLPGSSPNRFSLLVRWLREDHGNLRARTLSGGRAIAETALVGGSAMVPNLRRSDVRVEITNGTHTLATAWLRLETP